MNFLEKINIIVESRPYRPPEHVRQKQRDVTPDTDETVRAGIVTRRKSPGIIKPIPPTETNKHPGGKYFSHSQLTPKEKKKAIKRQARLIRTTKTAAGDYGEGGDAAEQRVTRSATTGHIVRRETAKQRRTRRAAHAARRGQKKVKGKKKPVVHRELPNPGTGRGGGRLTTAKKRIKQVRHHRRVKASRRTGPEIGRIGSEVTEAKSLARILRQIS